MPIIRASYAVAFAVALGPAAPAMAEDVINFGVQPSKQPILIAHGAGYLKPIEEKYKIKINLRSFSYGAPENQALAAGELQIASAGMGPEPRTLGVTLNGLNNVPIGFPLQRNRAVDSLIDRIMFVKDRNKLAAATKALDGVLLWNHYVVP